MLSTSLSACEPLPTDADSPHWWVTKEETGRLGVSWVVEFALHIFRLKELGTREAKSPGSGRVRLRQDTSLSRVPAKQICQLNIPDRALRGSEGGFGKWERKQLPRNITSEPVHFSKRFLGYKLLVKLPK